MSFNRRYRAALSAVLLSALLPACGAPLAFPALRVEAESPALRREAAAVFFAEDAESAAPPLHLRETVSEEIESLAADGTANAYRVNYALAFRWRGEERKIALNQIVSADESRYRAGLRARADAAERLRLEALRQARYILARLAQ